MFFSKSRTFTKTLSTFPNQPPKGAIVTNGPQCAKIGASIFQKGGSAVDAALASLFSEGVMLPNSMGLGGGSLMTIYIKDKGIIETLDCREVAPMKATENMFAGDSNLSTRSGLAVGVPGELRGYWELYKKYGGKVSWKEIVQPSIDLCMNKVVVPSFVKENVLSKKDLLEKDELLKDIFLDPRTGNVNQHFQNLQLGSTLQLVADCGADVLYNGSLTESFVEDIQDHSGIITTEDLNHYKPEWRTPLKISLPCDLTLYSCPLPGCGLILGLILNILNNFLDYSHPESVTNWHRIIESFKFGFGRRTALGDPKFGDSTDLVTELASMSCAEDLRRKIHDDRTHQDPSYYGAGEPLSNHGTSHICVLAPNGDAVAATSTINLGFGVGFMSKSTGIILNNQMDDFSSPSLTSVYGLPPTPANFIKPGKRPLSSMCPTIVLDKNMDVVLIVGAAGGPKIITSVALGIIKHLWFNCGIQESVSDRRLHHQLFPMLVDLEDSYKDDPDFVGALHKLGHDYKFSPTNGFSSVTAISCKDGILEAALDPRRGGEIVFV